MDRAGKRARDIKFHSKKNGKLVLVHSEEARAYTKYLEERPEVASYEAGRPLDAERLNVIQKTDIRGEYFTQPWASDFYIRFTDGTVGIREIVKAGALTKRAEVEKLELSRRYWAARGIANWKIVIVEGE